MIDPMRAGAPELPDPTLGVTVAGRYRVTDLLARGGMARVYRARDERLDRDVALKILSLPYADDPAFVDRFLAEARAAAAITHPNLVHVYDSGSDGALRFIAMELLDGSRSLRELLDERGRLPADEIVPILRDVLAGLAAVHAHGLVHCDVKPGNILVREDGAKLIDFGIAQTGAMRSETAIGTLQAMSPEQLAGGRLTRASDVFAVGAAFYQALAGRPPFAGTTSDQVAAAQRAGPPPSPARLVPGVPPRIADVALQALELAPERRFESAAAMRRALQLAVARSDEATETIPRAVQPPARDVAPSYIPPVVGLSPPIEPPPAAGPARQQPVRRSARRARRSRTGWLGGLVALALTLVAALVVAAILIPGLTRTRVPSSGGATSSPTFTLQPGKAAVPNTVGRPTAEAIQMARAARLNWTIRCNQDASKPAGIVDQEPAAGTPVDIGSRFTMYSARIKDCRP